MVLTASSASARSGMVVASGGIDQGLFANFDEIIRRVEFRDLDLAW